nr:ALPV-176 [Albatrosspox virus]
MYKRVSSIRSYLYTLYASKRISFLVTTKVLL